jgi:hypothetical protein
MATDENQDEGTQEFLNLLDQLSTEYDIRTHERHEMGEEKYGAFKWLGVDTLEEAMQEVLDLGNYARYTYMKLALLKLALQEEVDLDKFRNEKGEVSIGVGSFKRPTAE